MNWNIGKNIALVFILALASIGVPLLTTYLFGLSDNIGWLGLTGQEITGIGGFLLYVF